MNDVTVKCKNEGRSQGNYPRYVYSEGIKLTVLLRSLGKKSCSSASKFEEWLKCGVTAKRQEYCRKSERPLEEKGLDRKV